MTVKELEPKIVFEIFDEITKVPRPSKKEEKIRQFLLDFAKKHNLPAKTDAIGNVLISKAATPGHENAPTVILQGHMDMVCESNDPSFDFENSPIKTIVDGEWVKADGTTLGADNGIGLAAGLAALTDETLVHGPLEMLATVDEETGLTGADNIGDDMIKDGSILLNLDSEEDAEIFIGCAGGVDTTAVFNYKRSMAPGIGGVIYFKVAIKNGLGGHSGTDIHLDRINANKVIARFLDTVMHKMEFTLAEFNGGNLRNAIARDAYAVFGVLASRKEEIAVAFNEYAATIADEYSAIEPNYELTLESVEQPEFTIDETTTHNLVRALHCAPHGVMAMSQDIPGLVETSTNLAAVKMKPNNEILITTSQRSSVESRKWDVAQQVADVFTLAGAQVKHGGGYPGWKPNTKSPIVAVACDAYKELYGVAPAVKAMHAGLECGLFLTKYPHLDMVSFGPTLIGVHSPSEKMHIPAVVKFWDHLKLIITKVADLKK
ncbi:MAG: aminoacyl-histidine dipeptidase [Muribaculaceae bacterium]|nr:aminoacyl-histidine dipeptidase [Muribaculaceae bacterium]